MNTSIKAKPYIVGIHNSCIACGCVDHISISSKKKGASVIFGAQVVIKCDEGYVRGLIGRCRDCGKKVYLLFDFESKSAFVVDADLFNECEVVKVNWMKGCPMCELENTKDPEQERYLYSDDEVVSLIESLCNTEHGGESERL